MDSRRCLTVGFFFVVFGFFVLPVFGAEAVEIGRSEGQFSKAHLEPVRMGDKAGVAVVFEGTEDFHYYARGETTPGPGLELKIRGESDGVEFEAAVFPKWESINDPTGKKVEVYAGAFTVFVPFAAEAGTSGDAELKATITGIACTTKVCLAPFEKVLTAKVDLSKAQSWREIEFEKAATGTKGAAAMEVPSYTVVVALGLALLAGLSLNIMPCVWPVLPIIVMRLVEQAKQGKGKGFTLGLAFCVGILLFFTAIAGVNIVLQVFYGTVLQWGDQFRDPRFVAGMALLLVVLALFMFGLFTITVPSSISSKSSSGSGYGGAVGMGFLAAILSTPCSFAILAAVFLWAQAQPLVLGTLTIMVIGVGMAAPYLILVSVPGLLSRTPKPGRWMELFKQGIGFVLLVIAAKLIAALPGEQRMGAVLYAVVLSFCVWIWGSWVGFGTKAVKKWTIRAVAVALAVWSGFALLAVKTELIAWNDYDAGVIAIAREEGRGVLIKFTADWCTTCEVAEFRVFSREDIADLIEEKAVVAIKADTTVADYQATKDMRSIYGEPGVPVTILFRPGKEGDIRWRGMNFGEELKAELEKL